MLRVTKGFSRSRKNGLFINSCFAHCQSERQDTWFAPNSPHIGNKVRSILLAHYYKFSLLFFSLVIFWFCNTNGCVKIQAGDSTISRELVF